MIKEIIKKFCEKDEGFDKDRVLLHEPETCMDCGKSFLSLYPLKNCADHAGQEAL